MNIRAVIIPLTTFILGGLVVAGVFLEHIIPSFNNHLSPDVAFVDLGESQGGYTYAVERNDGVNRYNYAEILGDYHLAMTYLWHPLYFYKKEQGLDGLQKLAKQNYTQAAVSLAEYHQSKVDSYTQKHNEDQAKKHLGKVYHWTKLAAEQGDKGALLRYVRNNSEKLTQDELQETLMTLDSWAEQSIWSKPAWEMFNYYEAYGNQDKSSKFDALYTARLENPAPEPACMTITPWRGQ